MNTTLYMFEEHLGKEKALNNDLPLFISSYLKHKIMSDLVDEPVEIYPNAVVVDDDSQLEIDVYIPRQNIGIECKSYLSSIMPDTSQRTKSIAGELREQILNYAKVGIKQVYIIVNLIDSTLNNVAKELKASLEGRQEETPRFNLIQGTPDSVLRFLDELSSAIDQQSNKMLEERFKEQLPNLSKNNDEAKPEQSETGP